MPEPLRHAAKPCGDCPWSRDTPPGKFPAERYEALASTSGEPGNEAPIGAPMFACHNSAEGKEIACAGWLAVEGKDHLGVRLAVVMGRLSGSVLEPAPGWPALFSSYAEMARFQAGYGDAGAHTASRRIEPMSGPSS